MPLNKETKPSQHVEDALFCLSILEAKYDRSNNKANFFLQLKIRMTDDGTLLSGNFLLRLKQSLKWVS